VIAVIHRKNGHYHGMMGKAF